MQDFEGFAIPPHLSVLMEEVASQYPQLFRSRREFVNQAISYYLSIWTKPQNAEAKFITFLPHMSPKTLKNLSTILDEDEFRRLQKMAQKQYRKSDSTQKFKKLKNQDERHFLDDITIEMIEEIISKPKVKNYLRDVDNFFDQALNLFLIIWRHPEQMESKFFEMFEFIPNESKNFWKATNPNSYNKFVKKYVKWVKDNNKESENKDENRDINVSDDEFLKLIKEIKEIKSQRKILEKFSKIPDYVLPTEKTALISQFVTRFFPVKLSLAVLAKLIIKKDVKTISYSEYSTQVYKVAERLSFRLNQMENRKDSKIIRNKKISTGLPQHISINDLNNEKMLSSEKRFLQHYIGMKKSAWHKRQKKIERQGKNKISNFDGALNSFGLAYFVTEPKPDKDLKFSKKMEDIEIRVGITKKGIEFLMLENEILDEWEGEWYPSNWPRSISRKESKFIQDKIISEFSLEKMLVDNAIQTIKKNRVTIPSDLDMNFKDPIIKWNKEYEGTPEGIKISQWLLDNDYFDDNSEAILSWRTALMGRLSELKVVNWEISKQQKDDKGNEIMKGGVSQYSLVE